MRFMDTDELVETATGKTISDLWGDSGESHFRAIERDVIESIEDGDDLIVAVGGGAPMDDDIASRLSSAQHVIWLHCSVDELARRIGGGDNRPLMSDGDARTTLERLTARRVERYADLAHARIDTTGLAPEHVVDEMEALWSK